MTAAARKKKCQLLRKLYEGKGEISESGFLLYLGLGTKKCSRAVSTQKAWEYTDCPNVLQVSDSTWEVTPVEMYTQYLLIQGVT